MFSNFLRPLTAKLSPTTIETDDGGQVFLTADSNGNLNVTIAGGFTLPTINTASKINSVVEYKCSTAFAGASLNDIILGINVFDGITRALDNAEPIWYNATTKLLISGTVNTANLTLATSGGGGGGGDATAANQVTQSGLLTDIRSNTTGKATEATLASIDTKIPAAPATAGNQTSGNTTLSNILTQLADPATQTTLAAVLAKLSNDPATQTTLAAVLTKLANIGGTVALDTPTINALVASEQTNYALETGGNLATLTAKDFATQTTLASVLAKISSDPATNTTLTQVVNALPSVRGVQLANNSTSVTLASDDVMSGNIGAKADSSATTDGGTFSLIALIKRVNARLTSLISLFPTALTAGGNLKVAVNEALPAGTNIIGQVEIDQTTPFVTNNVTINGTVTRTNRSGTITTGGTAQTLMSANASRKGWIIQNVSSGDLWFNEIGGTAIADQPSFKLAAGAAYESVLGATVTTAISIIGATTGQAFVAREW